MYSSWCYMVHPRALRTNHQVHSSLNQNAACRCHDWLTQCMNERHCIPCSCMHVCVHEGGVCVCVCALARCTDGDNERLQNGNHNTEYKRFANDRVANEAFYTVFHDQNGSLLAFYSISAAAKNASFQLLIRVLYAPCRRHIRDSCCKLPSICLPS